MSACTSINKVTASYINLISAAGDVSQTLMPHNHVVKIGSEYFKAMILSFIEWVPHSLSLKGKMHHHLNAVL
jgi:hypothetical protein